MAEKAALVGEAGVAVAMVVCMIVCYGRWNRSDW